MTCCGARNHMFAERSQDFDRCHSFLPVSSAAGGARKRPCFGTLRASEIIHDRGGKCKGAGAIFFSVPPLLFVDSRPRAGV